eukprot:m.175445 g.175445  ORF g.175445 m.175445 type:complete len:58 (-) comp13514_c6_seq1:1002-1175(-)
MKKTNRSRRRRLGNVFIDFGSNDNSNRRRPTAPFSTQSHHHITRKRSDENKQDTQIP